MTRLIWDEVGKRIYQTGIDRGVLYLADGTGVAWNGLTSISETQSSSESGGSYFDGTKVFESDTRNEFSATLKVITYPDEFLPFDGVDTIGDGLFIPNQRPERFGLSYRTLIGNDIDGIDHGYKIHLVYDLVAVPDARTYSTTSNDVSLSEFGWEISAIPQNVQGYRPTAHAVIDTTLINRFLLPDLEDILYGTESSKPRLPTIDELIEFVTTWELITIIDHGDGTWTAIGPDALITKPNPTTFQITEVDAVFTDSNTYQVSTTYA